jgi:hypothetical protein
LSNLTDSQFTDENLLGGALSAISSLLKEISTSKKPLKVIKQEGFTILIEEGEEIIVALFIVKELKKVIRRKMQDFIIEFQDFFEELINLEGVDQQVFLPARKLVEKYFG